MLRNSKYCIVSFHFTKFLLRYSKIHIKRKLVTNLWKKFVRKKSSKKVTHPIKEIPLNEIKKAIREYSNTLPNTVPLSVLIHEDNRINVELLTPFLKAIPHKPFYMSKETYEVFEENNKHLAHYLDKIQRAVDAYIAQEKKLPIIDNDPYNKVSYYKLERLGLIDQRPPLDFYLTDEENLITIEKK